VVFWRWLRAPSAKKVAARLEALRALSQEEFARALEAAFRRDGFAVTRYPGQHADFQLERAGRKTLVSYRRWKAQRTGVEPLRELHEVLKKSDASEGLYVATGEVTEQAKSLARDRNIRLLGEAELVKLLGAA
jgi:restriction system protein